MASPGDDAYNTRLWSPGYEATLARLVERGASVRADRSMRLDIRWGTGANQTVDILPSRLQSDVLTIFLHGGYWQYRGAGKNIGHFLAPTFLSLGSSFAALTYELCPDVDMDAMVAQIRDAIAWIVRNSHELLETPVRRVLIIGHSAGAHLAAMATLSPSTALADLGSRFVAACGISGLYDLRPLVPTYLNAALRMDMADAWRNSPARLVRSAAPPFVLAVGERESPAFAEQTEKFANLYRAAGNAADTFSLPGRDHYDAIEDLAEPQSALARAIARLLGAG